MSARDDYPELDRITRGIGVEIIENAERQADRALRELDRLRAENGVWMNGVADAVEHLGFDRKAACGPADLLPGLRMLRAQIGAEENR